MHYPNLDRNPFSSTKGLQNSPPHNPNMLTPPSDPNKLKQYFAARFEALYTLEELHKCVESAVGNAKGETRCNKQAESLG